MLRRPVESALTASVRVVHHAGEVVALALPGPDRLLQRIQHQLSTHAGTRTPAQDPAGIGIDDERDIDPTGPRRDVGDVGYPQPVRRQRRKPATDKVRRPLGGRISDGRALLLATTCPFQSRTTHESLDRAARDWDGFAVELQPDLAGSIDTEVGLVDPTDLDQQSLITLLTLAGEFVAPLVVGRWGDLDAMVAQDLADRLDTPPQPIHLTPLGVFTDEVDDHCPGRSSSAAKKAEVAFRIALALFSSAFSRFNRLISADSSLEMPGR